MNVDRITVVGAGLGGLTFASVLHRHGVPVRVVDLDASPAARAQGGMLDIHEESGQAALRAAGLYDEFRRIVHPGGDATRVYDKRGVLRHADEGDGQRPEVSRRELRDLLLQSLPAGTIRWRAKVTGVRPLGAGRHEVMLEGGDSFTTDLLIGADGAWSRVRSLVSDAVPVYTGMSFVELRLLDADARHPRSAAVVGGGLMFALGPGQGFLAHRDPDGSLHVYAALRTPAGWSTSGDIDFRDTGNAKARLMDAFAGWDDGLRNLIADADGPLIPRPIHALPVGHRWERVPGVTLLGDAAHVMSPFAGEGANLAMQDGAELALALLARGRDAHPGGGETVGDGRAGPDGRPALGRDAAPGGATAPGGQRDVPGSDVRDSHSRDSHSRDSHDRGIEAALAEYEERLFPRSAAAAAESAANLELCFGPETPHGLVELFNQSLN